MKCNGTLHSTGLNHEPVEMQKVDTLAEEERHRCPECGTVVVKPRE